MILCDLPYGTTACSWDEIIPFEPMWTEFKRVIKPRGVIVLTASQPFTSKLVMSNLKMFRYEWIWEKTNAVDFAMAKKRPRKMHENILVFSAEGYHIYNPQMMQGEPYIDKPRKRTNRVHNSTMPKLGIVNLGTRYPSSIQLFSNGNNNSVHPTQKPDLLFEYLIRTYTQERNVVLDPCVGSGTTAVAARNTGRHYIVGDSSAEYVELARKRIAAPYTPPLFIDDVKIAEINQ
jgi:site-specific DNA-methyltransferase (adenine-specific)